MNKSYAFALAVVFASLAACSSSSSTPAAADAGADSGGPTADQACTASAQAQCNLRDACSSNHYLIARTYGDMATCVARLHDSCVNSLAAPGAGNTPANVQACAAVYSTISCADYLDGNNAAYPAACQTQPGTGAAGAACHFNTQCASAFCSIPEGLECGTCAALPTAGTPCRGPGAVSSCGGHLLDCAGAVSDATGFTAGTCVAYATSVGSSCDTTHPCGEGLSCTPVSTTATGRTCQKAGNAVGAACGGATNPGCDGNQGFSCNGKTHTCQLITVAAPGTACGTATDGSFTNCLGNGDCLGATTTSNVGSCRAAAADSASCDLAAGPNCGSASTCVTGGGTTTAGTCQFATSSSCH